MSYFNAPHFDLPFRINKKVAEVEQDTIDDVYNCVWASLVTPEGWRPEAPDFGMPDLTFETQPLNETLITSKLVQDEPRADVIMSQSPDAFDELIVRVTLDVSTGGTQ